MIARLRNIGPGALVAAAFIGPGTVTACTLAGANYGFSLAWALVFATIATIILQEMSARLGLVSQKGLGETLVGLVNKSIFKWPLIMLVGTALYLGNAAYEAGNLSGAALGIEAIAGDDSSVYKLSVFGISLLATVLLMTGRYKIIEKALIFLVLLMGASFIATFFIVRPDVPALLKGMFVPSLPEGSLLTIVALIGTTIVPYNLFLHAAAVKSRWSHTDDLAQARSDTILAVGLGGIITILILSSAAASLFAQQIEVNNASDMARQFDPLFGAYAKYLLGVGLFAAGLSSSITAPLATSYAMTEILNIKGGPASLSFRLIFLSVIIVGTGLALTGIKPISIIVFAQFANGLLLPIIAIVLLLVMNRRSVLGKHTNSMGANIAGAIVVLITAGLGLRLILKSLGVL